MKVIDLRSDTVTRPSNAMLQAMIKADVGDDVFGEDFSVKLLEETLAEMTGMQAAVFAPTGTQTNLMALMSHCGRGDEYIVGQTAHTYLWEGGGAAVLGSIQPQPMDINIDGTLDLAKVASLIKPVDDHHARTKLLCLENTTMGKVLPLSYMQSASLFCKTHHLVNHLDGARVFNAATQLNVPISVITQHVDSVSICLSKGLGTPMGSVLCGSSTFIKEARHWRKMLGGGMRQIGYMAAAGLYALQHNVERLKEDHDNAMRLAQGLAEFHGIEITSASTNIVFLSVKENYSELQQYLQTKNILLPKKGLKQASPALVRLVTHLDITREDIDAVLTEIRTFFTNNTR
jgi:threonine aldolase